MARWTPPFRKRPLFVKAVAWSVGAIVIFLIFLAMVNA
jgi:hypothetical protein